MKTKEDNNISGGNFMITIGQLVTVGKPDDNKTSDGSCT
jgi:hypothetical protein